MKLSLSLMKLIIKLLIILILIVMLFIIVMFLYSAKYWPDVYNFVNANITITHIPKRSEIVKETSFDETTEYYGTTNVYDFTDVSISVDVIDDDYFNFDDVENERNKRNSIIVESKDYSEVPEKKIIVDYFFNIDDQNPERINDLIDESKLTTTDMEDVEMITGKVLNARGYLEIIEGYNMTAESVNRTVFPWVAAIFIKNDTSNQFDYYCDGALVSAKAVLTAARCVQNDMQVKPEDLLVLLGKTSLNLMNEYERFVKVRDVILHDNYTKDGFENDIAILVMEDPVVFIERIQAACLGIEDYKESITTGWAVTGDLTVIPLNTGESAKCNDIGGNNTYCAVYENDLKVCPSYGGLHVARHTDTWHLHGIRHADPSDRGLCFDNIITFTDLTYYINWIKQYIE
ncbi:chymotrypsin-like elastase family member 2A isoform X2 [Nymphalis io]|uniref:chymotrypsin-like elastase family member 2A isoform X2 n=1 Tax=Inachis io TaxID=171585 RepID=UPI00216A32AC|nr:chymotrypsin-like elastase family member 2A isoform X2 [Nymphalis io]